MALKQWNLVADIGGTNARFGVADYNSQQMKFIASYSVLDHVQFSDVLRHFLKAVHASGEWLDLPEAACLAVACAVESDFVQFTNSSWVIERKQLCALLNTSNVHLINDFMAVGYGISVLKPKDWVQVGAGQPVPNKPIVVLGPGTGLGVCSLIPVGTGYQVVDGEGGHVDFAPVNDQEAEVLAVLRQKHSRVSIERLLSGQGIVNIYQSLAVLAGQQAVYQSPAEITSAALHQSDELAIETLHFFCRTLGSVAGDLALTLGAKGGVYLAGGILPRFIDFFKRSDFQRRFLAKGRFSDYLSDIPLRVVTKENLGLSGALKKLTVLEL